MSIQNLHIAATEETPEVHLLVDSQESYISGRSLPENAFDFYEPILKWITEYSKTVQSPLNLSLRFEYFNSSSGRYLFELIHILEKSKYKEHYKITWVTETDDELMIEKGQELKSLSELKFELVTV